MNSSISSSDKNRIKLIPRVLAGTVILLLLYWAFIQTIENPVTFAESDVNAGLLRLQNLNASNGAAAFTVGTSIIAKLHQQAIFNHFSGNAINMGLDGGSALFGARQILNSRSTPKIILLEANLVMKPPNQNTQTLKEVSDSVIFKLAEYIPILKREYRPVTLLYFRLKLLSDRYSYKKKRKNKNKLNFDGEKIVIEHPTGDVHFNEKEKPIAKAWGEILTQLKEDGASVILLMVPDSKNNRNKAYQFSRKLAARYNLPFVDLKAQLAGYSLVYSDGTHLTHDSATQVSELLNTALIRNRFLPGPAAGTIGGR